MLKINHLSGTCRLRIEWSPRSLQRGPGRYRRFQQLIFSQKNLDFEHRQWHIHFLRYQRKSWMILNLPTEKIRKSYRNSGPEQCIPWEGASCEVFASRIIDFTLENDGHNHTVDSNSLAKDNAWLFILYLTKFFERIRGAFTAAPKMLAPEMYIPLNKLIDTRQRQ
jgi:hypothetical protein